MFNNPEIDIFVRVLQKPASQTGLAIVLYRYKGNIKELYFSTLERTQNRSIILASIIAVNGLKFPCEINLYTQTMCGYINMNKPYKKWVNRDLGDVLKAELIKGNHGINYINCSITEEGKEFQHLLSQKLKEYQ